ncbi:hypothetical protein Cadr_000030094 [Camelus dromedarius]|uniref:Uncharacterized protein n=1 Tax=Camelus dromedarius TaxID=9838 RepID=A0A5N4C036_CAMDR|nr:hypothetical protein Cadr_000030094 [Camelus dromedarius]
MELVRKFIKVPGTHCRLVGCGSAATCGHGWLPAGAGILHTAQLRLFLSAELEKAGEKGASWDVRSFQGCAKEKNLSQKNPVWSQTVHAGEPCSHQAHVYRPRGQEGTNGWRVISNNLMSPSLPALPSGHEWVGRTWFAQRCATELDNPRGHLSVDLQMTPDLRSCQNLQ